MFPFFSSDNLEKWNLLSLLHRDVRKTGMFQYYSKLNYTFLKNVYPNISTLLVSDLEFFLLPRGCLIFQMKMCKSEVYFTVQNCPLVFVFISIKSIWKLFSFTDSINETYMTKSQKIVKIIMKCELYINNSF